MALKSYDSSKGQLIFECPGCIEKGQPADREIKETDLKVVSLPRFVALQIPQCGCGTTSYMCTGGALLGNINHIRAVLLKRRYEAEGGDGNPNLAHCKAEIKSLSQSYREHGTDTAQQEFDGETTTNFKLDKKSGRVKKPVSTVEKHEKKPKPKSPEKSVAKPVDEELIELPSAGTE